MHRRLTVLDRIRPASYFEKLFSPMLCETPRPRKARDTVPPRSETEVSRSGELGPAASVITYPIPLRPVGFEKRTSAAKAVERQNIYGTAEAEAVPFVRRSLSQALRVSERFMCWPKWPARNLIWTGLSRGGDRLHAIRGPRGLALNKFLPPESKVQEYPGIASPA
jgi:hypothetical protein